MSYYDYVDEHVFRPAGMTSTGALPESVNVPKRAVGYMRSSPSGGAWVPNTDTLPWRGTAAGGGYSTVGDLLRFAQALRSGRLISEATLAEATRPTSSSTAMALTSRDKGRCAATGTAAARPA
jgi:CubicO group peptidase (beta-lactamase class C family)